MEVIIYFITKFPRIRRKNNSSVVVVDKLTKAIHYIPVKMTHKARNIAYIHMKEISQLHGIPKAIMSDRDPNFTYYFWKGFFMGSRTNLNFNTTYHPKSNGKT